MHLFLVGANDDANTLGVVPAHAKTALGQPMRPLGSGSDTVLGMAETVAAC